MANGGWYGTKEEWNRIEQPLFEIDPALKAFAAKTSLSITKNHKSNPERSMVFWKGDVRCLIQVFMKDEKAPTFSLWICASRDVDRSRYWKRRSLVDGKLVSDFKAELGALLDQGYGELLDWAANKEQLEFATTLSG